MSKTVRRRKVPTRYKSGLTTFKVVGTKVLPLFNPYGDAVSSIKVALLRESENPDPSIYLKWYHSDNPELHRQTWWSKREAARRDRRINARILRRMDIDELEDCPYTLTPKTRILPSRAHYRAKKMYHSLFKYAILPTEGANECNGFRRKAQCISSRNQPQCHSDEQ